MEFPIPQFIEQAPKIVGPLTWRQFLFIGGAGAIVVFLFFIIKNFLIFIILSILFVGAASMFAFVKVGGRNLLAVLGSFLTFSISSKLYIWQKKTARQKIILEEKKLETPEKEVDKLSSLKMSKKSKLGNLSTQIETRTK
ncbi:PrgI family protein [Patescibacteria group bacterium]